MKDQSVYLKHILECITAIARYIDGGKADFFNDRKTQKAVLRELQELSESTQHLSPGLKEQHPEIPWQDISGFRNVLVHDYLGLSLPSIWKIIEKDLAPLKNAVETLLHYLSAE